MSDSSRDRKAFDHNSAWQSATVASGYDERRFRSLGGRLYDSLERRTITRLLEAAERLQSIESVLEIACGTGRITQLLASRGYQLTSGDISEEMLRQARARLERLALRMPTFVTTDVYDTGYAADSFSCVVCVRLFQHLTSTQRAAALTEMARVSRRFVLVNVMYTSLYYGAARSLRRVLGRYTTRYTSSRSEIEAELATAGLRRVNARLTQPGFNGNLVLLLEKIETSQPDEA